MNGDRKDIDSLGNVHADQILTQAIIDTIHDPLIVLDGDLRIIIASNSFYKKFSHTPETTKGILFYNLGNGEWNIPVLRTLLEKVIPENSIVTDYEVEHNLTFFDKRTLLVNARELKYQNGIKMMLLSISDITNRRKFEVEKERLLTQKDLLLKEMSHRIVNSLQLIASILIFKAASVNSAESRSHLEDAYDRILLIATIQQQLDPVYTGDAIPVDQYLTDLCRNLERSMIGDRKLISLEVNASRGFVSSETAINLGLVTTELVINAIKHAFPLNKKGIIVVTYQLNTTGWTLSISDNGIGQSKSNYGDRSGLGTSIIGAIANQLQAQITTDTSSLGTKVTLSHT